MPRTLPRICRALFEEVGGYHELVLLKDIPFQSHCEHHMAPIIGKASIAYMPTDRVVGISKLVRVLHGFARRLQVQERLTAEVANASGSNLKPEGVAVVIEAQHGCMTGRGVKVHGSGMVTSKLIGCFLDDQSQPQGSHEPDGLLSQRICRCGMIDRDGKGRGSRPGDLKVIADPHLLAK